ncbi:Importin beta-like SAD2-like protein [Quillaja saponaria]|uniref:Importin beta-like SAD2-like protein n=1 Tax=Quillaja saponaria TaxID=32244 RepID=A0AAD7PHN7_QUISA|nr:Importin beta-like SAD2-like protein [Quillaja saponaria]
MEDLTQIAQLLSSTLSPDGNVVHAATAALDRLSLIPHFPFSLLSLATGGENQGQKVAAATYLKNFTRRNIESESTSSKVSKEFKDQLMRALLQVEPSVLKILVEVFRAVAVVEFVKKDLWPELVPDLRSSIENSNLINNDANSRWKTINTLVVLHALLRPFRYFLNPKVAKEPVPPQLELISLEILVPLLAVFHQFVEKDLATHGKSEETEKFLLSVCKCMHYAVKSYMPSTLAPLMPSFCHDLIGILGSLTLDHEITLEDGFSMRLKTGKRCLLIFCALITRHRKYTDKLMPEIINCVLRVVKFSKNISNLDFLTERILSLGFDVISHVLETGPGWRLVSPHFMTLLDSAIFPALVMNERDISEWEEDADEYIRKNLPSDIEEVSGWREDLFTARKSAINLLGVISMSKGPPMGNSVDVTSASSKRKKGEKNKRSNQRCSMGELLVLPFLSKFPIPSDLNASLTRVLNDYFGVLMAYGGLQDFLREQQPEYVITLVRTRVLPLYTVSVTVPFLVASANWVLGELASCLPEEMSADVYSQLLNALSMPDRGNTSCYPVRVSAAGSIAVLLENDFMPPEWLSLLQVVIGNIGKEDNETSILFQLLSSVVEAGNENVAIHIPCIVLSMTGVISKCITTPILEPWPQVVEQGFAALAMMAQIWENSMPEESEKNKSCEKWVSSQAEMSRSFAALLQQAWLRPLYSLDPESESSPPSSSIDDLSTLLRFIVLSVTGSGHIHELKLSELLSIWADLIAEWHAWEEAEDISIFDCIKEVVSLNPKYGLNNFLAKQMPLPPAPPVPQRSILEGIGTFISEAILQYPSATRRACSCVHIILHVPTYSFETVGVKQSLAIVFCQAAFSRFREVQSNPCSLWKPLLLAISSCYVCYPDIVEGILEKGEEGGFAVWASALCYVSTSSFEPCLTAESEMKLTVMALVQVVEQLLRQGKSEGGSLQECFTSVLQLSVRLKEVQEENEDEQEVEEDEDDDDDDDNDIEDDDEDSEAEEYEETEDEFLDRYAKSAVALENGSLIEEGDVEDQDLETELGNLIDVDQRRVVLSLIEKYHHVLIPKRAISSQLILNFLDAFPECSLFFQQSR